MIGRLRQENGILFAELEEALALQLRKELLANDNAKEITLKVPGFGIRLTQDMVWDAPNGISLHLWKNSTLAIIDAE